MPGRGRHNALRALEKARRLPPHQIVAGPEQAPRHARAHSVRRLPDVSRLARDLEATVALADIVGRSPHLRGEERERDCHDKRHFPVHDGNDAPPGHAGSLPQVRRPQSSSLRARSTSRRAPSTTSDVGVAPLAAVCRVRSGRLAELPTMPSSPRTWAKNFASLEPGASATTLTFSFASWMR